MVDEHERERRQMVEHQIVERGIDDPGVIEAFLEVPRHLFVPQRVAHLAYRDGPLDIGEGQTISQPYMVAIMVEALRLRPSDRVLEVGTGSGYGAAILSRVAREVITVERLPGLAQTARERLDALGFTNVRVVVENGSLGWPAGSPYDAIVVTAAAPRVPPSLVDQLSRDGGRLVIPVGDDFAQELIRLTRWDDETEIERLGPVRFVPLIGAEAHPA